ncbi:MAG: hypothetical protein MJK14_15130 [Rivularia sp. ALOHA_DT_140]|nr:hypothetical protein [Rivularia sp. ALOHA_DT_140]
MQQVVDIVGNISRIISLVRWGARAIACVSPPAVGCLWALGQAALEELAAVVVQSCWFQRKIAPWVSRVDYLRNDLPRSLATTIISSIQGLLPEGLRDVFTDVTVSQVRPEEIDCDTSEGSGKPLSDEQRAILELQEQLGEARFTALMELLQHSGVNAGVPFNRAMAEQIGRFIEHESLTVQDLRRFAQRSLGRPREIRQFLRQLRRERDRSPVEPVLPEPPPSTSDDTESNLPEYSTVVVASRDSDSEPNATDTSAGESGRQSTDELEVDAQSSERSSGIPATGWSIRIVRVRDGLVAGNVIRVDMRMSRQVEGRPIVRFLRNLRVEVVEIIPSDGNPSQQEAFLEVVGDQHFVFSSTEGYAYSKGTEFVYRFNTRRRR